MYILYYDVQRQPIPHPSPRTPKDSPTSTHNPCNTPHTTHHLASFESFGSDSKTLKRLLFEEICKWHPSLKAETLDLPPLPARLQDSGSEHIRMQDHTDSDISTVDMQMSAVNLQDDQKQQ